MKTATRKKEAPRPSEQPMTPKEMRFKVTREVEFNTLDILRDLMGKNGAEKLLRIMASMAYGEWCQHGIFPMSMFAQDEDANNAEWMALLLYMLDNKKKLLKPAMAHWGSKMKEAEKATTDEKRDLDSRRWVLAKDFFGVLAGTPVVHGDMCWSLDSSAGGFGVSLHLNHNQFKWAIKKGLIVEDLPDGVPCNRHRGCLSHLSHPCEGCGRTGGKRS